MFFKVCNLYAQYAAILYFADGYTFWFEILVLNNLGGNTYSFDKKVTYSKNNIPLSSFYITLNDFVKIDKTWYLKPEVECDMQKLYEIN